MTQWQSNLVTTITKLRDEHRVKHGTDYAVLHKYGEIHILTARVWQPTIQREFDNAGLTITTFHYID